MKDSNLQSLFLMTPCGSCHEIPIFNTVSRRFFFPFCELCQTLQSPLIDAVSENAFLWKYPRHSYLLIPKLV